MKKYGRICAVIVAATLVLCGCGSSSGGKDGELATFTDEPTDELNIYIPPYHENYFKNTLSQRFN